MQHLSASASWRRLAGNPTVKRTEKPLPLVAFYVTENSLRGAPDGLPEVSTYTIWKVLKEAGFEWQRTRSWGETAKVKRKRKKSGEKWWWRSPTPMPRLKNLIERAYYREGEKMGI